jgi:hypothetical protein
MTRNDIIKMAREAGIYEGAYPNPVGNNTEVERFAALVEKHLFYDGIHTCNDQCQRPVCVAIRRAVNREREACALAVEQAGIDGYGTLAAAAMIRARGNK